MVQEYHVDPRSLAKAVREAARWTEERRAEAGRAAREHFENRNRAFAEIALDRLEKLR